MKKDTEEDAPFMSAQSKNDVLKLIGYHYGKAQRRAERSRLLDELCRLTGWGRKHALKRLRGLRPGAPRAGARPGRRRGGSARRYTAREIVVIKALWLLAEQPCGKRMRAVIALWLPSWEQRRGPLEAAVREKLLRISAAQIDRVLRPFKTKGGRRPAPGTEVRGQIPLRTGPWEVRSPGWLEADTVAHCGGWMGGSFAWSVAVTDIATQWTECRACWNRSDRVVHQRVAEIEAELPFPILGFDTDNGGEFINHLLLRYFRERERPVSFTRSRPYHKNDNAHIEQKNRTHIRGLPGYERLGAMEAVEPLNELLRLWSVWNNLYSPSLKLLGKERRGAKVKKTYEKHAQTPAQRVLASADVPEEGKARVRELLARHDPIELKEQIERRLAAAWEILRAAAAATEVA